MSIVYSVRADDDFDLRFTALRDRLATISIGGGVFAASDENADLREFFPSVDPKTTDKEMKAARKSPRKLAEYAASLRWSLASLVHQMSPDNLRWRMSSMERNGGIWTIVIDADEWPFAHGAVRQISAFCGGEVLEEREI